MLVRSSHMSRRCNATGVVYYPSKIRVCARDLCRDSNLTSYRGLLTPKTDPAARETIKRPLGGVSHDGNRLTCVAPTRLPRTPLVTPCRSVHTVRVVFGGWCCRLWCLATKKGQNAASLPAPGYLHTGPAGPKSRIGARLVPFNSTSHPRLVSLRV